MKLLTAKAIFETVNVDKKKDELKKEKYYFVLRFIFF